MTISSPLNLPLSGRLQKVCSSQLGECVLKAGRKPLAPVRATPPPHLFMPTPHRLSLTAGRVGLSLGMEISFPDGVSWRLHETWRAKLFEAEVRYTQTRNLETKAEYLQVLRTFKDLVLYDIVPQG